MSIAVVTPCSIDLSCMVNEEMRLEFTCYMAEIDACTAFGLCTVCNNNNKHLRCGNRKGLLGRTDQTHHRMDPNTMASRPPTKQY